MGILSKFGIIKDGKWPAGYAEKTDPKSLSVDSGLKQPLTMEQLIDRALRQHEAKKLLQTMLSPETDDEMEDFDIAEDPIDPTTPWEKAADAVPIRELRARIQLAVNDNPALFPRIQKSGLYQKLKGYLKPPQIKPQRPVAQAPQGSAAPGGPGGGDAPKK